MKTYQEHLRSTNPSKNNPIKRKPVLRSSAIFPFMINKFLDTKILFLGYWLIKRNIKQVKIRVILRSRKGLVLSKKLKVVNKVKAFSISVKKIIDYKDLENTIFGSIELEVFSKQDMIYPSPAFVINFEEEFIMIKMILKLTVNLKLLKQELTFCQIKILHPFFLL